MSSSNDNNSANNQITQGLDIESEADASMNIPTQHNGRAGMSTIIKQSKQRKKACVCEGESDDVQSLMKHLIY